MKIRRLLKFLGLGFLSLLAVAGVSYGVYYAWYTHRAQPANETRSLFKGIDYRREAVKSPVPMVNHIVTIQLDTPGLSFVVTPPADQSELPLVARTTSQFAREFKAQLAINADFFYPWHSNGVFDYYPHIGDRCTTQGFAASRGVAYSLEKGKRKFPTLYLSADNKATFQRPKKIYNAVSGLWTVLKNGEPTPLASPAVHPDRDPRSAVGISKDGKKMILIIIDGRQPNYSEGGTIMDVAQLLKREGAYEGILLDGGGSSCLVTERPGKPGEYETLNSVIDKRLPGRERPIANHLGIQIK